MAVSYRFTDKRHGDLALGGSPVGLRERRRALDPRPWTWLKQVHGSRVVTVTAPGEHAGAEADAVVTEVPGCVLAVNVADCAPLILVCDAAVGVAHIGWRGLMAGVVESTVASLLSLGHQPRRAVLGPCIRPRCYEFGATELAQVADLYGPTVRSTTAAGQPGLDLAAAISVACGRIGVEVVDDGTCTACSPQHWSHRARGDVGRQSALAVLDR